MSDSLVVEARNVSKIYRRGAEYIRAIDDISFQIGDGESVAVVGPSGSGKTTLLQLVGGMDAPTSGELRVAGQDMTRMGDPALTRLRRAQIGFVFQHFGLLPTLSVEENVLLPALFARRVARERAEMLLARVGLSARRGHRPGELSGGEMQRTAIARALINQPRLLLADEPTGNLDTEAGRRIIALLQELRDDGLTVIVVTHNEEFAHVADRRLVLRDGRLVSEEEKFYVP